MDEKELIRISRRTPVQELIDYLNRYNNNSTPIFGEWKAGYTPQDKPTNNLYKSYLLRELLKTGDFRLPKGQRISYSAPKDQHDERKPKGRPRTTESDRNRVCRSVYNTKEDRFLDSNVSEQNWTCKKRGRQRGQEVAQGEVKEQKEEKEFKEEEKAQPIQDVLNQVRRKNEVLRRIMERVQRSDNTFLQRARDWMIQNDMPNNRNINWNNQPLTSAGIINRINNQMGLRMLQEMGYDRVILQGESYIPIQLIGQGGGSVPPNVKKQKGGKWIQAVKIWNTKKKGVYCIPKKNTKEYDEVKKIMSEL